MNDEEFKQADEAMMKRLKSVRERKLSPEFLRGFAASVVRRIEAGNAPAEERVRRPSWRPAAALVPVFAVLVLAVVTTVRLTSTHPGTMGAPDDRPVEIAQLPQPIQSAETKLAEDIETLKELGVWTEDDEKAAGVASDEEEIAEVLG